MRKNWIWQPCSRIWQPCGWIWQPCWSDVLETVIIRFLVLKNLGILIFILKLALSWQNLKKPTNLATLLSLLANLLVWRYFWLPFLEDNFIGYSKLVHFWESVDSFRFYMIFYALVKIYLYLWHFFWIHRTLCIGFYYLRLIFESLSFV